MMEKKELGLLPHEMNHAGSIEEAGYFIKHPLNIKGDFDRLFDLASLGTGLGRFRDRCCLFKAVLHVLNVPLERGINRCCIHGELPFTATHAPLRPEVERKLSNLMALLNATGSSPEGGKSWLIAAVLVPGMKARERRTKLGRHSFDFGHQWVRNPSSTHCQKLVANNLLPRHFFRRFADPKAPVKQTGLVGQIQQHEGVRTTQIGPY